MDEVVRWVELLRIGSRRIAYHGEGLWRVLREMLLMDGEDVKGMK